MADEVTYHPRVVAALSKGFCPKHGKPLSGPWLAPTLTVGGGYCRNCRASWELTATMGTIPTTGMVPPPFAVTHGSTVLVARDL